MDEELLGLVARRLDTSKIDDNAGLLVLAACEGDAALVDAVGGGNPVLSEPKETGEHGEPVGAYLESITVEGFRGIGEQRTLELAPGPGLTLVVGRNGSGKSSFVEALEVLLTGDSKRWSSREAVWKDGWRNLHHPDPTALRATIVVDGQPGVTTIRRSWDADAGLADGSSDAQADGAPRTPLSALGWDEALVAYRPILSYNELGSILDQGPSKLYDAVAAILGLEDLAEAQERLRQIRLQLKKLADQVASEAAALVKDLRDATDERAERCIEELEAKSWSLDAIGKLVTGSSKPGADQTLDTLRSISNLTAPGADTVVAAVAAAREAVTARDELVGSEAAAAANTVELLRAALAHHEEVGDETCPVCGAGSLDASWHARTVHEIERLERISRAATRAKDLAQRARQRLSSLQVLPAASLPEASRVGLPADRTRAAWEQWLAIDCDDLAAASTGFEAQAVELVAATDELREAAAEELAAREDTWAPYAEAVAAWLERARAAESGAARGPAVTKAESWIKDTIDVVRNERLAPIASKAAETWALLSEHSNVELGPIQLTGSAGRRRVSLDVSVDGVSSVALSVMSQGELHALALAIFLPRVTAAQSPFRFVIIDDPVQAMDPAKVDGLARVLEATALTRQVVVFTHDDRLPQAVRLLGIDATVLQVTRRDGSRVSINAGGDPALVHLDEAIAIALTDELPEDARRRVVPGYCRLAIEAVLNDVIRRKLLLTGVSHASVEEQLAAVTTLNTRAALAFFGDAKKGGEVLSRLGAYGPWAQDAYQTCNKHSHDAYGGGLDNLVRDTRRLVEKLRTSP